MSDPILFIVRIPVSDGKPQIPDVPGWVEIVREIPGFLFHLISGLDGRGDERVSLRRIGTVGGEPVFQGIGTRYALIRLFAKIEIEKKTKLFDAWQDETQKAWLLANGINEVIEDDTSYPIAVCYWQGTDPVARF